MKIATLILLLASVLLIYVNEAIKLDTERMIREFCKGQKERGNKD